MLIAQVADALQLEGSGGEPPPVGSTDARFVTLVPPEPATGRTVTSMVLVPLVIPMLPLKLQLMSPELSLQVQLVPLAET